MGLIIFLILVCIFFACIGAILTLIGEWNIFKKAGIEGWKVLIPIYNIYVHITKIARRSWIYFIILFILPVAKFGFFSSNVTIQRDTEIASSALSFLIYIVGIAIWGLICWDTARNFGRSVLFAFGLFFLPFIFTLILGLGDSKFQPSNWDIKDKIDSGKKDDSDYFTLSDK